MTDYHYSVYEKGTKPAPSWDSCDAATLERRLAWAMLGHTRLGASALPWAKLVGEDADTLAAVGATIFAGTAEKQWTRWRAKKERDYFSDKR